jgi:hypothetical protein
MATMPAEPRTVGDLIQRLEAFDRDLPVVVANALTGTSDNFNWILMVGPLPPEKREDRSHLLATGAGVRIGAENKRYVGP